MSLFLEFIEDIFLTIKWYLIPDRWASLDETWYFHPACGKQSMLQHSRCPRCGKPMRKTHL